MKAFEKALYSTLSGDTTLCNLVGGTISPRIYNTVAEPDADVPFVVFHKQGGGESNDTPRNSMDLLYVVKAVSCGLDAAETIDEQCKTLLNKQTLTVTSYSNYGIFRGGNINFSEEASGGLVVYHIGAFYRCLITGE